MDLLQLPKVELHLHLDCSLSYEVVAKIDPSISYETYQQDFIAPVKCHDLADFLTRAVKGFELMQTKEQLTWVVEDLFKQLAADNVIYAEIRFAPLLHIAKGLTPLEVVETVEAATAKAVKDSGIEARLILCTLRHYNEAQSMQTVELVNQFKGSYVAGFDIAGDEAGYPVDAHIKAFNYARKHNLHVTAHAGEGNGPESVWETLEYLRPSRIGHGVRSYEDASLVAHLIEDNIHLEVCPTCNVQTDMYDTIKQHPVDKLYKEGVSININTDCRTIVNTNLRNEYEQLHTVFGWGKEELYQCNVNAVNASFIPAETKEHLLQKLKMAYEME